MVTNNSLRNIVFYKKILMYIFFNNPLKKKKIYIHIYIDKQVKKTGLKFPLDYFTNQAKKYIELQNNVESTLIITTIQI